MVNTFDIYEINARETRRNCQELKIKRHKQHWAQVTHRMQQNKKTQHRKQNKNT